MIRHAIGVAILAGLASPAFAEDAGRTAAAALDALFPKGETACFAGRYDAAYLKVHPTQSVSSVRLMRGFQHIRGGDDRTEGVYADIIVTYAKSGDRRAVGGATCKVVQGAIVCASDGCDGGSFQVKVENPDTIVIGEPGAYHFTLTGGCLGGDSHALTESDGDRVFRLKRGPVSDCR